MSLARSERIRNFGPPIPLQAQNVHCIHFDDQMSGYLVDNNSFVDSWVGVMLGGGRSTTITHNRFEKITHAAIEFDNRGETWQKPYCDPEQADTFKHSFYSVLKRDKVEQPPWSVEYPYLQRIAQDSPCVPVHNNMSYNSYCECGIWITAKAQQIAEWESAAVGNVNRSAC